MSLQTHVIKRVTQLNQHHKCVCKLKRADEYIKPSAEKLSRNPIMSSRSAEKKLRRKFISLQFNRLHVETTENTNGGSDVCDDKFLTKQNLSAALRQFNVLFCGYSWWNIFLLFYALLCAMVEIYEIYDSIMQIRTKWMRKRISVEGAQINGYSLFS